MVNLKFLPEHIQLLNSLAPHLGKKGQASADKFLGVLSLLAGQSPQGGLDSVLKLVTATGTKLNDDVLQVFGKMMRNMNIGLQNGHSSSSTSMVVFLLLFLLLQDF